MGEEKKGRDEEKVKASELPFRVSDEYKDLVEDFSSIIESGKQSFQESADGRKIEYVSMYFAGRYGVIVEVDQKGIPKIELTRLDVDNTGQQKIQKFLLGLRAEASTKAKSNKTTEFSGSDSNAKNFEVNSSGYELVKRVIGDAQKEGERKQKKIEDEEIKYFAPFKVEGISKHIDFEKELDINLNEVTDLVVMARQIVKEKLGAKLESVNVTFFKFGDSIIFVSSEGHKINQVIPRTGFTILVKTKEDSETYGCIRGVGGMEVLRKRSPGKTNKEIVSELAELVVKQAFDMDKAQNSGILGSECPVILSASASGVLAHEVFGHTSEADIILESKKKTSEVNLKSRIGGQVSENTKLTIVDIASLDYKLGDKEFKNSFGSMFVDDIGTVSKDTTLIENGVQVNVLNSRYTFNEILEGLSDDIKEKIVGENLSGNVRSENFSYSPIIRMRNTCILPDDSSSLNSIEEMAAKIPKNKTGVYVHISDGGWIDPDTGVFEIIGALCYLIQNSTIVWSKPIRNVRVCGNITKFGGKIKYIGTSKTIDGSFSGYCGKDGQRVPVECAGPAIYVEDATIGSVSKSLFYFKELYGDWREQVKEKRKGVRDRESIYFKQVEEVSTKVGFRRKKDHSSVCMVSAFLDIEEERGYITGEGSVSDFTSSIDGKLVRNKGIID